MGAAVRPHHLIGREQVREVVEVEVAHRLKHRGFHHPALAARFALMERGEHADRGVKARHSVRNRRANDARVFGIDQQPQKPAGGLRDSVKGRAIALRPLAAKAGDRGVDEARVDALEARSIDIQPIRHTGAEILDEDIGLRHQLVEHGEVLRVLGINRDRTLIAVVGLEMRAVELALEGTEGIARAGLFDLDDIGAQIGQDHPRRRAGDESAHFEHGYVLQWLCRHDVIPQSALGG